MIKIQKSGYPRGIEDEAKRASMQVKKLKRFKATNTNDKTRVYLYK